MGFAQYDVKKVEKVKAKVSGTERIRYFDGIGEDVQKATSLETAIKMSKLDFEVVKYPIDYRVEVPTTIGTTVKNHHEVPKFFATVRKDTGEALGVVGERYEILQNQEAFDFLDSMAAEAKFETAGSYGSSGAKSFITMSTEPMNILGDEFKPYMLFTNSFDGSGSIRVMFTPIRVFCSNCLAMAIKNATSKLTIRHSRSMQERLKVAREILLGNSQYMEAIKEMSEKMALKPYTSEQFKALVKARFSVPEDANELAVARADEHIAALLKAYNQDDLQNYNNTVYKAVQAFADYESHKPVFRQTTTMRYKNIDTIRNGMPMTNAIASELMAAL